SVKSAVVLLCSKVYLFSPKKVRSRANSRIFALWCTVLLENPYVFEHTIWVTLILNHVMPKPAIIKDGIHHNKHHKQTGLPTTP
ncbi:MAG: hypothetical protein IKG01_01365, partial [Lachnospiraceae bacterium]|nr:hypothetical protein [Lachnospiraceae bacterium]